MVPRQEHSYGCGTAHAYLVTVSIVNATLERWVIVTLSLSPFRVLNCVYSELYNTASAVDVLRV